MKILVAVILILSSLIGFCTWVSIQVDKDAKIMNDWLEQSMNACRAGNWQQTEEAWDAYETLWDRHRPSWLVFLRHMELDWVEQAHARAEAFLWQQNADLFVGELNVLMMLYSHIPENESLQWDVIL